MPASGPPPAPSGARSLLTVGHGTATVEVLAEVLRGAGVRRLVDVRRHPGSRRHPHVAREALTGWLPDVGVAYRWEPRLGGRRSVPADARAAGGDDPWWQVEAFRAYAAHTRSAEFQEAMDELLAEVRATDGGTAVLCSETVWWRCHRRLVADVAVLLHGVPVEHLGHDGRRAPHPPAPGARVTTAGLVYDGPGTGPPG